MNLKPDQKLTIQQFLALEKQVWEAFLAGDPLADSKLLADNFLGVYSTGYFGKLEHCEQLRRGPIVAQYELHDPRILVLASDTVLLSYLALWTRAGSSALAQTEKMYVSSLWQRIDGTWKNVFSQDTTAG